MSKNIEKKLLDFIKNNYDLDDLDETQDLLNSGLLDSIKMMQVILFIEQTFNITFSAEILGDIEHFSNIKKIATLIVSQEE